MSVILAGKTAAAPRSKFTDMVGYVQCLKQDPYLMIAVMSLLKLFRRQIAIEDITRPDSPRALPMKGPNLPPVVQFARRPNRNQRWTEFMMQFGIHWIVKGTAIVVDVVMSASGAPIEIALLDPAQVVPKLRPDGSLESLRFGMTGPNRMDIPGEACHVLRWNPDPEGGWLGQGIVAQNETHFNITTSMEEWIWSLFTNGQIPDGVLTVPGELTDEIRFLLYQQFEDRHRGAKRQHKPLVVEQGATYTPGKGPQEMDFGEGREARVRQTLAMMGVPPIRVGRTDGLNFASAFISDAAFLRDTYEPTADELAEFFDLEVWERFGAFHGAFTKQTPLGDPAQAMATAVSGVAGMVLTPNEARETIGKKRVEGKPEMDQFYAGAMLTPAADVATPPAPVPGAATSTGPAGSIPDPFAKPGAEQPGKKPAAPGAPAPAPAAGGAGGSAPASSSGPAAAIPDPFAAKASPLQRRVLRHAQIVRRHLAVAMSKTAAGYFRWLKPRAIARFLAAAKDVAGVEAYLKAPPGDPDAQAWQRVTRQFYVTALKRSYSATLELFGAAKPSGSFGEGSQRFAHAINRLATKVQRVDDETRAEIDRVIRDGLTAGYGPQVIAHGNPDTGYPGIGGLIESWYATERGDLSEAARATLIGRTETSAAYDQASVAAYQELGVTICDVIGCEDNEIVAGQKYGCNSQGVPIADAPAIEFHPNHKGVIAPRVPQREAWREAVALTAPDPVWNDWLKDLDGPRLSGALAVAGIQEA